jgi:hypothetical protein
MRYIRVFPRFPAVAVIVRIMVRISHFSLLCCVCIICEQDVHLFPVAVTLSARQIHLVYKELTKAKCPPLNLLHKNTEMSITPHLNKHSRIFMSSAVASNRHRRIQHRHVFSRFLCAFCFCIHHCHTDDLASCQEEAHPHFRKSGTKFDCSQYNSSRKANHSNGHTSAP